MLMSSVYNSMPVRTNCTCMTQYCVRKSDYGVSVWLSTAMRFFVYVVAKILRRTVSNNPLQ